MIATEDIGLAYPNAITITKSCVDSAMQLGFPEARIPLAQAVVLLATSPKSNSAYLAINSALSDIDARVSDEVPSHLKDAHYLGAKKLGHGREYLYPHNYPNHYVAQDYLPANLVGSSYYEPQDNKFEKGIRSYMDLLKKDSKK